MLDFLVRLCNYKLSPLSDIFLTWRGHKTYALPARDSGGH